MIVIFKQTLIAYAFMSAKNPMKTRIIRAGMPQHTAIYTATTKVYLSIEFKLFTYFYALASRKSFSQFASNKQ